MNSTAARSIDHNPPPLSPPPHSPPPQCSAPVLSDALL